ncbi:hypothetical protein EMMF5_002357 [Cystobasidiomycetes sp. EMM_F5]
MSGLGISFQGRTYERGLWDEPDSRTSTAGRQTPDCLDLNVQTNTTDHIAQLQPSYKNLKYGRGSDDSQISLGPLTPNDLPSADAGQHILPVEPDNFLVASRRAPVPPSPSVMATPGPLQRRLSKTAHSMMKSLGGRKKEVLIPPPLPLPQTPVPVHHIVLADNSTKSAVAVSTPAITDSQASRKDSLSKVNDAKTPRSSFSSIVRSIRSSISASRKNSAASIQGVTSKQVPAPVRSPIIPLGRQQTPRLDSGRSSPSTRASGNRQAPSVRSTVSKHRPSAPSVSVTRNVATSPRVARPQTAPADRVAFSSSFGPAKASPVSTRSYSTSNSPVPIMAPLSAGVFDVDYVNPWARTYQPSASFVSSIPISPGESVRSKQHTRQVSHTDASLYKQSILVEQAHSRLTAYPEQLAIETETAASSPRRLPSLRIAEVEQLPNFLHLSPSVRSAQTSLQDFSPATTHADTPAHSIRQRLSISQEPSPRPAEIFLTTPGKVALRNPFSGASATLQAASAQHRATTSVSTTSTESSRISSDADERERQTEHLDIQTANAAQCEGSSKTVEELFAETQDSPVPAFHNPFLARLSQTQLHSDTTQKRTQRETLARKASFAPVSHLHPQVTTTRDSSVDYARRQSSASALSSFEFPSRPTRLEARRMTGEGARGLRVSIDTDGF